jgi:hypothetical protein
MQTDLLPRYREATLERVRAEILQELKRRGVGE